MTQNLLRAGLTLCLIAGSVLAFTREDTLPEQFASFPYEATQDQRPWFRDATKEYGASGAGAAAARSIATRLGVSEARREAIQCLVITGARLYQPVSAINQMQGIYNGAMEARDAYARGDYETAAVSLMRSGMNAATVFGSLREMTRMARAFGSLDPQRMRDYLTNCFAAGTPIRGEFGAKAIESYHVGDRVWARADDDPNAPAELKPIEEVFVTTSNIWHVHVGGQVIRTTDEHPFFVRNKGWTSAQDLQEGDVLVGLDLNEGTVEEIYDTGEFETVYNFRVAQHHTYFVGDDNWGFAVWAHNACVKPVDRPNMPKNTVNGFEVSGTAQRTIAGGQLTGHATAINNKVQEITAQLQQQGVNPSEVCIVLNRSWSTATGVVGSTSGEFRRLRPDILVVRQLPGNRYQFQAYECRPNGQTGGDADLLQRMSNGFSSVNNNAGNCSDLPGVIFGY